METETRSARKKKKEKSEKEEELQPPAFKGERSLKDYQVEGFRWLLHCYNQNRNCILADEMGLGKTIQTISLLQYLHSTKSLGPFLVIAPMSTIENWKREVTEWTDMKAIIFHGNAEEREELHAKHFPEKGKRNAKSYKFQVMITTYEVTLIETRKLKAVPWEYLVIDEGHRIKNQESKLFGCLKTFTVPHKLILTGTPLQNGIKELWALMNFLEPDKFDSCNDFLEEFGDLTQSLQVDNLHKKLGPYLLRRVKEGVEASIPQKEETLIELELTLVQKQYYRAVLERNRDFLTKGAAKASLMNIMMQQRKVCNHPYLLAGAEDHITSGTDKTPESELSFLINSSSKLVFLDKLLARLRENKKRVLIFSQMVRLLDLLEDYLHMKEYPYERLDGSVKRGDRQEAIDRFMDIEADAFVFLLGTRAGGLGINLTIADTVVIFDSDWNPQNDIQAQARVHRIGQQNTVKVYRLITRNTYEKYMFEVASKKLGLDRVVLGKTAEEEQSGIEKGLQKEEIERLLKYGAHDLFKEGTAEKEPDFDFDKIMETATTVTYGGDKMDDGLANFSKATFVASEQDAGVDLNDSDFWDKVLPSFRTTKRMEEQLNDPTSFDSDEKKEKFLADIKQLIEDVKEREKDNQNPSFKPMEELLTFLRKVAKSSSLTENQKEHVSASLTELEKPRLRKREITFKKHAITDIMDNEDEDYSFSSDEEEGQTSESESSGDERPVKRRKKSLETTITGDSTLAQDLAAHLQLDISQLPDDPVAREALLREKLESYKSMNSNLFKNLPASLLSLAPGSGIKFVPTAPPKKRKKKKKDVNKPKRWLSSFIFFANHNREELRKKNPNWKLKELAVELARMWRETPEEEKKVFEEMSQADMRRYNKEMETYVPPEPSPERKEGEPEPPKKKRKRERDPEKPRRSMSSFIFYANEKRPLVKQQFPDLQNNDITKKLSEAWNKLPEQEKQVYKDMATQGMHEYYEKMKTYQPPPVQPEHIPLNSTNLADLVNDKKMDLSVFPLDAKKIIESYSQRKTEQASKLAIPDIITEAGDVEESWKIRGASSPNSLQLPPLVNLSHLAPATHLVPLEIKHEAANKPVQNPRPSIGLQDIVFDGEVLADWQ